MVIRVKIDDKARDRFLQISQQYYIDNNEKRKYDYHIGDGTMCLRKSMIPYIFPSQNKPDVYDRDNFMRGLGMEHSVVDILKVMIPDGEFQMDIYFDKITGHPDYTDPKNKMIFEIKATNITEPITIESDYIKSYIRQIVYYMLLTGYSDGIIVIKYSLPFFIEYDKEINKKLKKRGEKGSYWAKIKPHNKNNIIPWLFISVNISEDEPLRNSIRDILTKYIKPTYFRAINNRDLTIIPVLDEKKERNWKCTNCKAKKICDMIPDKQNDPEIRKYLLNKHIDDVVERISHQLPTISESIG